MSTTQRYPAEFSVTGPAVDYLEMQFIRRNYSSKTIEYKNEAVLGCKKILINIPQKVTEAISQQFNQTTLGETGAFLSGGAGITQSVDSGISRIAEDFLLKKGVDLANKLGATNLSNAGLLSATSGVVFNPNLEVLYEGPDFRRFNFQFNLFTKSREDATSIFNIVEVLRSASLPSSTGSPNAGALSNAFYNTAAVGGAVSAIQGAVNTAGGALGGLLSPNSTAASGAATAGLQALGNLITGPGATAVGGALVANGAFFKSGNRFITQPPFVLLTYKRGAQDHPFIRPLLPAAIDQINFDFTPTGNYTTVGEFNNDPKATTVGVTITMQLTEVTNLFSDSLFASRAPGVTARVPTAAQAASYNITAPPGQQYGPMSSDARLKENIVKVGSSPSGINIYEWNYKSAPDTRYRGVMAQEIMQSHPDAIHLFEDGYMGVHYGHLDVNMEVVK